MGAARTGRMTSGLVQVQNLVKASKEVGGKFDLALSLLKSGDYEGIKKNFSSPLDVACAALRPILCAAPGKKFVIADLSAIEARGAGWVTECEPLLEVFRQGRDPYIAFAAQMDGHATYEELWETYKAGDKTARTNAKAPTLGCFGEDTMVLTNHGVKKIVNVTLEDKLWDGGEWVSHDGCVYQGDKKVINLLRVDVTPEHGILTEEGWKEACEVTQSGLYERSAINLASGLLPDSLRRLKNTSVTLADAGSAAPKNWSIGRILKRVRQVVASLVPEKRFRKTRTEYTSDFRNLENLLTGWRTGTTRFCRAAGESVLPLIATEDGGFSANLRMCTISSDTALPLRTMTSPRTRSTEKIMTAIMKKGIFDLLPQKLMGGIKKTFATSTIWEKNFLPLSSGKDTAPSTGSAETSAEKSTKDSLQKGSLQNSPNAGVPTFDILNSGPRSRFTILTEKGPLIVHNCGYGLSAGEETTDEEGNSVKTGLLAYAENMGIELTLEYAEKAVQVYRNTYREVEQYWYDLHRAFARVVENDTTAELGPIRLEMKGRVLCVWLPSGRALHYINPSVTWVDATSRKGNSYRKADLRVDGISQVTHQWTSIETRGAKTFENIVQAFCRDILFYGMHLAKNMGFQIVLTCHDEIVAEVDEDSPLGVKELVECMTTAPPWASDFLLGAEGMESLYYTKG
jgi:DNA polymerase